MNRRRSAFERTVGGAPRRRLDIQGSAVAERSSDPGGLATAGRAAPSPAASAILRIPVPPTRGPALSSDIPPTPLQSDASPVGTGGARSGRPGAPMPSQPQRRPDRNPAASRHVRHLFQAANVVSRGRHSRAAGHGRAIPVAAWLTAAPPRAPNGARRGEARQRVGQRVGGVRGREAARGFPFRGGWPFAPRFAQRRIGPHSARRPTSPRDIGRRLPRRAAQHRRGARIRPGPDPSGRAHAARPATPVRPPADRIGDRMSVRVAWRQTGSADRASSSRFVSLMASIYAMISHRSNESS